MSSELNELRLQIERLDYDNKERNITIDILKEQHQDAKNESDELRKQVSELKTAQKDALAAGDKEKRKQEKMAMMMAKFDAVCYLDIVSSSELIRPPVSSKVHFLKRMNSYVNFW